MSLLGAAWFALAALEVSLLGACALDCEAGAAAEEDAALVESIEFELADGLAVDELPGLLAAEFELLLTSELVPLVAGLVVLPAAARVDELLVPLGVDALDWFIADVSLEPPGVAAAGDGEVVLPADPVLLPVVQ